MKHHKSIGFHSESRLFFEGFYLGALVAGILLAVVIAVMMYRSAPTVGEGQTFSTEEIDQMKQSMLESYNLTLMDDALLSKFQSKVDEELGRYTTINQQSALIIQSLTNPINKLVYRVVVIDPDQSKQNILNPLLVTKPLCLQHKLLLNEELFLTTWDQQGTRLVAVVDVTSYIGDYISLENSGCVSIESTQSLTNLVIHELLPNSVEQIWLFDLTQKTAKPIAADPV